MLVAVGHAFYFPFDIAASRKYLGAGFEGFSANLWGSPLALYEWIPSGFFPVALFFILSGFVLEISVARLSPLAFAINRTFRTYPTFLVAFALHAGLSAYTGEVPASWPGNLVLGNSSEVVPVSWTLLFEVRYYLAVCILALFKFNGPTRAWILILYFSIFGTNTGFWLSYMALGSMLYHCREKPTARRAVSLGLGLATWYVAMRLAPASSQGVPTGELAAALFVFTAAVWLVPQPNTDNALLTFLGNISYPLYCVHFAVVVPCWYLLAGAAPSIAIPFVAIATSLLLAFLVHVGVEKPGIVMGRLIVDALAGRRRRQAGMESGSTSLAG